MICGQRFLDCLAMARQQIDTQLFSVLNEVAASVAITLGVLAGQLLEAGLYHGEGALLIALRDRHLLAERLLKYAFEVRQERRLRFATLRVSRLARLVPSVL